ncbi:MAG TPA: Holliday junction branch migration DNA helicase RuvB [Phycisphaerae bacterium]|nr:Holliday junction branch migration DNA helicase RuvB [Phycisphaerales bacterium]HRX85834.1 Holliday junction branch migration DNA helicase RuvB [Phycisphaerae bacterium]
MARERIISGETQRGDTDVSATTLRPRTLDEMVGQTRIVEKLEIAMHAARQRGEPLEHMLFDGPPGLGKTTFAHVVAREMSERPLRITSGPALSKQADLMPILTNLERGDILFIDEVHRLPKVVEEFLYTAMEDFRVDVTIEGGLRGRVVNFNLQPFTLIGATTRAGMLSGAMRDRFGLQFHLDYYGADDLRTILHRSATRLELGYEDGALDAIALRSRGTPRVANRMLRRVRDYAQVRADGRITQSVAQEALNLQGIDDLGLDELDRAFLTALMQVYGGGPAGIEALAATMGQERDTLEDVVEPYLLQIGFVVRTRQGRQATKAAFEHMGLAVPKGTVGGDASPTLF